MRKFLSQVEVVDRLSRGWAITAERTEYFGARGQTVYSALIYGIYDGDQSFNVHPATISSLIRKKVITGPADKPGDRYKFIGTCSLCHPTTS